MAQTKAHPKRPDEGRGRELADFLRSRRARLTPKALGLRAGQRRRTPGLRREEVAELAGIGVDWYVRLEQGRAVRPSAATIDALARALRLSKAEHAHLRILARTHGAPAWSRESVPDAVRRVVEHMNHPAYITGRRWDVLAWNAAADDLFGFSRMAEAERNTLLSMFVSPGARKRFGAGWADEARRMLAQFRSSHDVFAHDPAFRTLVAQIKAACPDFDAWWKAHDVRAPAAGHKKVRHWKKGVLAYEVASFQANDDASLKLTVYAPAAKAARTRR